MRRGAASMTMLAKTGSGAHLHAEHRDHSLHAAGVECTQLALDALLDAQTAATRRPPFRVTPAHVLLGLLRQHRSAAGELLAAGGLTEKRVWAAFDYRKWRLHGMRRLRGPLLGARPRWTRAACEVVAAAARESRGRDTPVVDTIDLLAAISDVGDAFAAHLLDPAHISEIGQITLPHDAHLVELERSPTTQLPSFTTLRKLHT